jgi:hypothetical protein
MFFSNNDELYMNDINGGNNNLYRNLEIDSKKQKI